MSGTPDSIPEELYVLAGEFVLGALETGEMRAVRRQAMVNPALAAAIAGWEQRLAPMIDALTPINPPDALWERIADAIAPTPNETDDPVTVSRPAAAASGVAPPAARPVPAPFRSPDREPLSPLRSELDRLPPPRRPRRVWPWQIATAGSLALAAGIAAVVMMPTLALRTPLRPLAERLIPQVAAILPSDSHASGFLAQTRPDGTVVLTALAQVDIPTGKSLELWILPPGATAPKSLGVLPADGRQVTLAAVPPSGTALLVSLEPPGGSPTGAPTGPVLYAGTLRQLAL